MNTNKFAYIIQESRMRENLSRQVGIDEGTKETVRQIPELHPCPTLQFYLPLAGLWKTGFTEKDFYEIK